MTLRHLAQTLLVVAALVSTTITARAATVETKVRAIMRDRPAPSARIVDRLPSGKKLKLLGQSGNWIHVRAGTKDGWISASELKGLRGGGSDEAAAADANDQGGDDQGPVRPLARPRGVRPEAWVSKSRYHDGEDVKLIVSVNKAELYGRPSATGAVLGILRRGEAVQLVKRSVDKKWVNIDIGGGETAWIEARAVKPGRVATETPPPDESAQAAPAEEAPQITPEGAKKRAKLAKNEAPPPPEEQEAPRKNRRMVKNETPPEEEAPPPKRKGDIENETPPGLAPSEVKDDTRVAEEETGGKRKKKKVRKIASRDAAGETEAGGGGSPDVELVRDQWNQRGKVYIIPELKVGFAVLSQRFTSNGNAGALTNYNASTAALGAQVGFGIFGTAGKYLLFGGDASYTFAGLARYKVTQAGSNTATLLGVSAHTIDGGVSAGVHFGVLGGRSVRLRLGGQMVLNLIQPSAVAKLPSDRILGLTIALGVGVPALFHVGERAFGLSVFGGGLVPAQRAQTVGLEDGQNSSTFGGFFGGTLSFMLMPPSQVRYKGSLMLEASYAYEFVATHYTGASRRLPNAGITVADRGSAQHLGTLGLAFYY